MNGGREFKDIRRKRTTPKALPVRAFMENLESLPAQLVPTRNELWYRVADGTLSIEHVQRLAKEYWTLGVWFTAEFGTIISNAPDVDAVRLWASEHYAHWTQNLADETGYAGDPNHVDMKVEWCHLMGVTDDELETYQPIPETLGVVLATGYYIRRSYEEGLAAFGWAGERFAASTGYARLMYEGLRDHYGIEVENFKIHAYAEADHGDKADYLLRQVAVTGHQQHRIRTAVTHVLMLRNARNVALNGWLKEPGALRKKVVGARRAGR
jgi:pyrroloquinoline quinone (PQQ) biosynthesis protein C